MTVYMAMAIDFPQWAIEAIDKIRKGFLWGGRKEVKGCLVAWEKCPDLCSLEGPPHAMALVAKKLSQDVLGLACPFKSLAKLDPSSPRC
jgi:hypothetical protein